MTERSHLDRLFRPRSVAVVGASTDPAKIGGRPLRFLREHGFAGEVWPVNPRAEDIAGLRCYPSVDALPGTPDAAIVLVGARHAAAAIRDLAARGTGAAIVFSGGFSEVGGDGAARQAELVAAAGSMRVLGPNTVGLVNVADGITLSASNALDAPERFRGGVAVVSQSGGILGSLLSRASYRGIGLSHLVATGNEADIEVGDLVDWLAGDPATKVIALYLETLRNPGRFRSAAARAHANGKRLVAYKVGRSEAGARSAASHTGALAGEDRFYDALFERTGVVRVERFADLVDVGAALALSPPLAGRRLAILTTTGGAAGLVADVCGVAGFDTPAPGPETAGRLAELLDDAGYVADRNPIDLTLAGLDPAVIEGAIDALSDSPDFDAVVSIAGSSAVGRPALVADPVIRAATAARKPIFVYTSPTAPDVVRRLNAAGVPAFEAPEACAAALAALAAPPPAPQPPPPFPGAIPMDFPAGALDEAEAKALFASFGIPSVREAIARTPEEAGRAASGLGASVVVKLLSRAVAHKTEIGGVRVGVPAGEVAEACRSIAGAAAAAGVVAEGFLVQEQVRGAAEMILGLARDPQLGPAVLLGGGGTLAELYGDTAIRLLPLARSDVEAMLGRLKVATILNGHRGSPAHDVPALIEAVLAFAAMCGALGDRLLDAEINPLFVLPEGQGVRAADGVARLGPEV
jgi:acyl-CoA synthetase (NDP forming)